jgi:hypothetical protein
MGIPMRVGWRPNPGVTSGVDADATAFISAAGITNLTQANAINTLVTDLKTAGIWTKMKAIYPFVGGTASSHKFNLKDPRDLDAAYRLVFNGGWTHSSTGALPNGTTAYADTKLTPSSALSQNSTHVSYYSRTNNMLDGIDFGVSNAAFTNQLYSYIKAVDGKTYFRINRGGTAESNIAISDSRLFYMINRNSPTQEVLFTNTTKNTFNYNSTGLSNYSIFLGSTNHAGTPSIYGSKESAFASIGDGLTDTEAANFYNSVQKFQTTLGRQVGVPIVSDSDAQAFLNAAVITNTTQASAINTLVSDLKTAGIWTKMKAIYPFVGGSAATHKFNLKDARDLAEAYRLVFNGGGTHDANGYKGNGTTAYANTYLNPSTVLTQNNIYFSWHSNTNSAGVVKGEIGQVALGNFLGFSINGVGANWVVKANSIPQSLQPTTNSLGFYQASRLNSTQVLMQKNSTQTTVSTASTTPSNANIILLATTASLQFSDRQLQLVVIGEGLTADEMNSMKTINDNYKAALGR